MTPLAHKIARQLTLKPQDRGDFIRNNSSKIAKFLADCHFFDCTAIGSLPIELSQSFKRMNPESIEEIFGRLSFLPAPKTWIEWNRGTCRIAVVLEEVKNEENIAVVSLVVDTSLGNQFDIGISSLGLISLDSADFRRFGRRDDDTPRMIFLPPDIRGVIEPERAADSFISLSHFFLVCINSPRIIGRRQHMPHAGLEKDLRHSLGVGKFPLHGWTEILLKVSKPTEIDDGEPHEAHLTGRRALHFCRKHIRIRQGRLEYVSAHWRGDPALGIKQSRYTVTA